MNLHTTELYLGSSIRAREYLGNRVTLRLVPTLIHLDDNLADSPTRLELLVSLPDVLPSVSAFGAFVRAHISARSALPA